MPNIDEVTTETNQSTGDTYTVGESKSYSASYDHHQSNSSTTDYVPGLVYTYPMTNMDVTVKVYKNGQPGDSYQYDKWEHVINYYTNDGMFSIVQKSGVIRMYPLSSIARIFVFPSSNKEDDSNGK